MTEKAWLGVWCLGAALVLGALGDVLFRGIPWGINVFLWTICLAAFVTTPFFPRGTPRTSRGTWMLPAALLFAAFVAWRDSTFLAFLNVCGAIVCLSLAAWGRTGRLRLRGVSGYIFASLYTGAFAAAGPLPTAVKDIEWDEVAPDGWRRPVSSVLLGLCIAAPLLFVFGTLLASADAVFADILFRVFDFDLARVFSHSLLILFVAWVSAGYLRTALSKHAAPDPSIDRPSSISLGAVELGIALGLLNALFLAFVVVQARYLFGGAQRVAAGLTYAEYARSGFFELVAVAALALPTLLLAHWLFTAERRWQRRIFDALAATTVALVLVIMVSALWRMRLYYEQFGLTELRLYSTAFMLWLGIILALFLATVLRNRRDRFASLTLVSGLASVFLLNAINPDALIARANIERLEEGKRFDPYYLTLLSADAAPVIVEALPEIAGREPYPRFEKSFLSRWKHDENDWRSWNLSRMKAQNLADSLTENGRNRGETREIVELSTTCCGLNRSNGG